MESLGPNNNGTSNNKMEVRLGYVRSEGSQLGFRVYEEFNFNEILRTLWELFGNFTYIQDFFVLLVA